MKVDIDREGCIGCGACAAACPEVFRLADDGFAEVYSSPEEELSEQIHAAADGCPVNVISVED